MWLFFQQHAAKSKSKSNSNAVIAGAGAKPDSFTKPDTVAEPDAHARGPIGLIPGDLVFPCGQEHSTPGHDNRGHHRQ